LSGECAAEDVVHEQHDQRADADCDQSGACQPPARQDQVAKDGRWRPAPDESGRTPGRVRAGDRADGPERRDRGLLRLVFGHPGRQPAGNGLAQVILGLGHDEPGLRRRELQACPELVQVFLDQVRLAAHAGHPTTA
jgi:hypothetical protein